MNYLHAPKKNDKRTKPMYHYSFVNGINKLIKKSEIFSYTSSLTSIVYANTIQILELNHLKNRKKMDQNVLSGGFLRYLIYIHFVQVWSLQGLSREVTFRLYHRACIQLRLVLCGD